MLCVFYIYSTFQFRLATLQVFIRNIYGYRLVHWKHTKVQLRHYRMKNLGIATEIFVRHAHDHYNFLQNFVMVVCIFHWLIKVWWILNYKLFTSLELYFAFIYLNFNICGCTYLLMKTLYLTAYQMKFIKKKFEEKIQSSTM